MKNYYDIQNKKLKIEEINVRARANEVETKQKKLELELLTKEAKIITTTMNDDMDLVQRAWLEKKMICDRDVRSLDHFHFVCFKNNVHHHFGTLGVCRQGLVELYCSAT
jgi:hypothetical protein